MWSLTTTTLRRSISRRTIRRATRRIRSTLTITSCCGRRPRQYRFASWSRQKPPIRVIAPGRVYRCDAVDATHSPLFHQIEGLVVDKGITMGDLKGTLEVFAKAPVRRTGRKVRFRPHHFPVHRAELPRWTCPVLCVRRGGLSPCVRGEGWIETLGCGMLPIRRCWQTAASTQRFIAGLRSGWGWSVSRCAAMTSTICACSLTTTCGS